MKSEDHRIIVNNGAPRDFAPALMGPVALGGIAAR